MADKYHDARKDYCTCPQCRRARREYDAQRRAATLTPDEYRRFNADNRADLDRIERELDRIHRYPALGDF